MFSSLPLLVRLAFLSPLVSLSRFILFWQNWFWPSPHLLPRKLCRCLRRGWTYNQVLFLSLAAISGNFATMIFFFFKLVCVVISFKCQYKFWKTPQLACKQPKRMLLIIKTYTNYQVSWNLVECPFIWEVCLHISTISHVFEEIFLA